MPSSTVPLSDSHAYPVRCLAGRREIYVEHWPDEDQRKIPRDVPEYMSALFVPRRWARTRDLLIASTMQAKSAALDALMKGPGLRRSELAAFLADARTAAELVLRGLTSAAQLVDSFKQVAVDRTGEQRRQFKLLQVCRESIATMMNRIRAACHVIELDIADHIVLDSYPSSAVQYQ